MVVNLLGLSQALYNRNSESTTSLEAELRAFSGLHFIALTTVDSLKKLHGG